MRLVIALLLASCATDPSPGVPVSIEHGIYGYTWTVCDDTSTCTRSDLPTAATPVDASQDGSVVAATRSDATGLFQLDVPAGTYQVCVRFASSSECTAITTTGLVRADWESGPGGGGWYLGGR